MNSVSDAFKLYTTELSFDFFSSNALLPVLFSGYVQSNRVNLSPKTYDVFPAILSLESGLEKPIESPLELEELSPTSNTANRLSEYESPS